MNDKELSSAMKYYFKN